MISTPNTPLTIYKASAGSGKTFTLAVEYIRLLIKDPQNYRYILAVTFTNKATEEMKTRILSQLYGIAHSLTDSEDYMERMRETNPELNDTEIRGRAKTAMELLLHHYNYFRVETIDSFFQSVLRNLARELDLTANLQVSLNDYEVESQAVDNIIENIQQENDPLLGWIMDFVQQKIGEDKNWNVIGQIKEFGRNIFKDFYKEHQAELQKLMYQPDFFKSFTARLRQMKTDADEQMKLLADAYQALATTHGLTSDDYSGRSSAPEYFEKLGQGKYVNIAHATIDKCIADPNKLVRKADADKPKSQVIIGQVAPMLKDAEELRRKAEVVVNTVDLTLKNINELRLLGRIQEEVRNINTVNNNYPLSNTQKLLRDLIDQQDSPFIYEKIGGQLRYIMIDEFQDTSTVQWDNFKILLDDCLAHNAGSLIVGDVKQSIYRWRNGDWRLLQQLSTSEDFRIGVKTLDTNYRSQANIILFNNEFFEKASALTTSQAIADIGTEASATLKQEAENIRHAYIDVAQKIPQRKAEHARGSVTIKLLESQDYDLHTIMEVKETVEQLLGQGIPARKIAVLVRKNKHIQLLADYFQQHPLTVNGADMMVGMVSDEAFRLDASLAVNTLVDAMHVLGHPDDKLAIASLVKSYYTICPEKGRGMDAQLFIGNVDLRHLLPNEMLANWEELLSTPLSDLAERLYSIFELNRLQDQSAYVCAFFDQISAFLKNNIVGVEDFLQEWENSICGKSIHSDEVDGIRLLTIHKSKGLEYDNVIIPFCDWEIEKNDDVLWVTPEQTPYDELPVVPVNMVAKRLQTSIYRDQYQSEHIKNLVDNLNVLYVAFTRASRNLFVFGKNKGARFPSLIVGQAIQDMTIGACDGQLGKDECMTYRFGDLCLSDEEKERKTENIVLQKPEGIRITISNHATKAVFRQSRGSTDFITPDDEMLLQQKSKAYIQTGNILHALFATIRNINDVDAAIDHLEFEGVLYDKPTSREELRKMIDDRMQTPQVKQWFDPSWQVFNECNILYYNEADGRVREERPDRVIYDRKRMVVIDFKTGAEKPEHHAQVYGYVHLLEEMGYDNIAAYLWYITPNKIVTVKSF